ncbi:MAG: rod shape-determining protein MreD [Planctomycetes bacterium]|jgi:rod shape-determining protein MreD|nr:rod shape-determining protein MreD [Planctomycetota bacterium]
MRWLRLLLSGLVLVLASLRWPEQLAARGFTPVWLLLPGLCAGLASTPGRAALTGFCFGLLADLCSLEPLGVHAVAFGVAALLLSRIRGYFFCDHPATQAVLGFVLSLLVLVALLSRLAAAEPSFRAASRLPVALAAAVATAALLPLLAAGDRRLGLFTDSRRGGADVQS